MNRKFGWIAIPLLLAMSSCGGDGPGLGGLRDGPITETPDDDAPPPVVLSSMQLLASSSQLQSDGSTTVTLTAFAKNENNQVVAGVPIVFSADSGALVVLESETNEMGIATAELNTQGDPANRVITVTATAASGETDTLTDSVDVSVIGSSLQIQGPTNLVLDDTPATYTITLANSAGVGIAGRPITITSANGNTINAPNTLTNSEGRVDFTLAGINPGADTLNVSALPDTNGNPSVTASLDIAVSAENFKFIAPTNIEIPLNTPANVSVEWRSESGAAKDGETISFKSTRGILTSDEEPTDANGVATVQIESDSAGPAVVTATTDADGTTTQIAIEFVATVPNKIALQASPKVIGLNETSTITAIVRDAQDNFVKNQRVKFSVSDKSGGHLTTSSAVTDSLGRASTIYNASSAPSSQDGVVITAQVEDPAANCGTGVLCTTTSLTVAGGAAFISFGTGNSILEDPDDTIYTKVYTLFVTDVSGAAVAGAEVKLKLAHEDFFKGSLTFVDPPGAWQQFPAPTRCVSEDTNGNNLLDTGEDTNGDGELTPGNVAQVAPGTITTDENGQATFKISYPQNYAFWVEATVSASTRVSGTESVNNEGFYFPMSADDAQDQGDPPNRESPWGIGTNCADML